jgi:teichuronic acid exporter
MNPSDLKNQAISGVIWNFFGKATSYVIEFIVGIILARLLSPREFGLIGTIVVFVALADIFINSGFSQALIRKKDCTQEDYSTVFFFNLLMGIFLFFVLFLSSGQISRFFNNSELKPLIQVLGIVLIISSLSLIQRAKLTREIDFRLQTKISVIASVMSGTIAVTMAYLGFGVWSLVVKTLVNDGFNTILLWSWSKWKPDFTFSLKSFKELFSFGSKLLISGLIGTLLQNINYIIIAKYFTPQDLGYFTRAEMFKNLPSQNISAVVTTVGYPVLSTIQEDKSRMKDAFRKMFTNTFFLIVVLMAGMAATSRALIVTIVGEQWLPSVSMLQLLCILGVLIPINSMNVNVLNVVGRSDLYLKLQMIVQSLSIPNIFIGVFFGIKALILGMILIAVFGYIIFNFESNKILNYPIKEQIKDIYSSVLLAASMAFVVFLIDYLTVMKPLATLIIQGLTGLILVIAAGEILNLEEYGFFKKTFLEKIQNIRLKFV